MAVPSLKKIALQTCIRNIRNIEDVGDLPYQHIRDLLLKLESPAQLKRIEIASPQICETDSHANDAEIWFKFCKADITQWDRKWASYEVKPRLGWDLYAHLMEEQKAKAQRDADEVKAKMVAIQKEEAKKKTRILDPSELPQKKKRRVVRNTTGAGRVSDAILKKKTPLQKLQERRPGPRDVRPGASKGPNQPTSSFMSTEELRRRQEAKRAKEKEDAQKLEAARRAKEKAAFPLQSRKTPAIIPERTSVMAGSKRSHDGATAPKIPTGNMDYLNGGPAKKITGFRSGRKPAPENASLAPTTSSKPKASEPTDLNGRPSDDDSGSSKQNDPPRKRKRPSPPEYWIEDSTASEVSDSEVGGRSRKISLRAQVNPFMKPKKR